MKSNLIQALKKLLVAFGGAKDTSEVTDTNIVPIIDKLADAVGVFNPSGIKIEKKYIIEPSLQYTLIPDEDEYEDICGNNFTDPETDDVFDKLTIKINNQKAQQYENDSVWFVAENDITHLLFFDGFENEKTITVWGLFSIKDFDFTTLEDLDTFFTTQEFVNQEIELEVYENIEIESTDYFIVTFEQSEPTRDQEEVSYTCDKTQEEIQEALQHNKIVIGKLYVESEYKYFWLAESSYGTSKFQNIYWQDEVSNVILIQLTISGGTKKAGDIISYNEIVLASEHYPTAADPGQAQGEYPTAQEYNQLITNLKNAGIIKDRQKNA